MITTKVDECEDTPAQVEQKNADLKAFMPDQTSQQAKTIEAKDQMNGNPAPPRLERIKFSHFYNKMPLDLLGRNGTVWKHWVIAVSYCPDVQALPKEFLDGDTAYWDRDTQKTAHYPLDFKEGLLVFIYSKGQREVAGKPPEIMSMVWQTIRRFTPDKAKWYESLEGEEVRIVVDIEKKAEKAEG